MASHASDAFALHVESLRAQPLGVRQVLPAVLPQPHRQQPDLAMPQPQHIVGELAHRRPVVNAHPGYSGQAPGLVDHHHGHTPLQHHLEVGIVVADGIHHEAVHPGGKHRSLAVLRAAGGPDGDQHQALPPLLARLRHSRNEIARRRVAEEIGQRLGHQQTNRTRLASA